MEKNQRRILIVCVSVHKGNTWKVAERLARLMGAELKKPEEVKVNDLGEYNLVGFGSGIYAFKHHKLLMGWVDKLPQSQNKKAFVFSTSGMAGTYRHKALNRALREKGFEIVGEFNCKGWDEFGPFKLWGGMNKGRPNEEDLKKAEEFARGLVNK